MTTALSRTNPLPACALAAISLERLNPPIESVPTCKKSRRDHPSHVRLCPSPNNVNIAISFLSAEKQGE
jgi:hypothetical protein